MPDRTRIDPVPAPEPEGLDGTARLQALARMAEQTAFREPRRALELVAQGRRATTDPAITAAFAYAEALARYYLGDAAEAIRMAIEVTTAFEQVGDEAGRSQALSLLADACNRAGRLSTAIDAAILSLEAGQQAGNLSAVAWAICALGNTTLLRGDARRAAELFAASRDAFVADGDRLGEAWMTGNIGEALCRQGELERGIAALENCLELVTRHAPSTAGMAHAMLASAYAAASRHEDALASAERGVSWARSRGSRDDEGLALAAAGSALVALGRAAEAAGCLDTSLAIGDETGVLEVRIRALLGLGELHAAEGRDGQATERLAEALALATAQGHHDIARTAARALAHAYAEAGRHADAYETLRTTLDGPVAGPEDDLLQTTIETFLSRFGPRTGITLICASCKSVHDTLADHWRPVEGFLTRTLEVQLSHGLCPTCFSNEMRAFT